jgi:aminocarboxymuconate-semialdehyde decarboxylase
MTLYFNPVARRLTITKAQEHAMAQQQPDITRRDFLKLAGKTATVSASFLAGCTAYSTADRAPQSPRAVDIHHHYFAPELIDEIKRNGKALGIEHVAPKNEKDSSFQFRFANGRPLSPDRRMAEVDHRLDVMTRGNIGIATVEVHTASVGYELDGPRGEAWSKLYNEGIQALVKRYPSRFAGIATVPLQEPPRAARVLEYAIRDLKMVGVTIPSNVLGKYYDSKDFDPFWAKVQELDVLMIMHPEWIAGGERMGAYGLRTVCGNPADTTLSVGYMIYSGVFDRYPNLKLALLHGGGFFPYHLGRFDNGYRSGSGAARMPAKQPPSQYLKNLYFDNLVYRVETVEYLKRMVGSEHIMVGTDYPFDLGDWKAAEKIETMNCTDVEREAMLHGNARKLLRL